MNTEKFAKFLQELRKENHFTQAEVAKRLHVSASAVSKWERGKCLPDVSKLGDIAELFQVSILEILNCELAAKDGAHPSQTIEASSQREIYQNTIALAASQTSKRIRRWIGMLAGAAILVCLIYFFPMYHIVQVWEPSYYETGEIGMLATRGSLQDRKTAEPIMELAEKAFSEVSIAPEEASRKYGELARYCTTSDYQAISEKHVLRLWSAHFELNEGTIWVHYSQEAFDQKGETVCGSWDIPSLWYLERTERGSWEVRAIKEHP